MTANDRPPSPSPAPDSPHARTHVRWIGGVDGHLELTPTAHASPLQLSTPDEARQSLKTACDLPSASLAAVATFYMFMIARTIPPTSQSSVLIEALRAGAADLESACPDAPHLHVAAQKLLNDAISHRGIGVRQLQVRLLHEASALLQ